MNRAQLTRRIIIDIARRRQRPGTGSTRSFLRERTAKMIWPDLSQVLRDVPWAVVGAVATRLYMPERATRDLGVAVTTHDAAAAQAKLAAAGWVKLGALSIGGSSWASPDGVQVDVLEGHAAWWPTAIADAQTNRDAQGLPILPLPYLVLMKFQSGRTVDIGDITRILGQAEASALQATREMFKNYEPDGIEDLESLIALGQLEMTDGSDDYAEPPHL